MNPTRIRESALETIKKPSDDMLDEAPKIDAGGASIQGLRLARLITTKDKAGRPKDMAMLPVLRATLVRMTRKS
jgi:predicted nucleotidyltransferase